MIYYVLSSEPVVGDEYYTMEVADIVPEFLVKSALKMAEKYSNHFYEMSDSIDDLDPNDFDEFFDDIHARCKANLLGNGQEVFNFYIEECIGWDLVPLRCHFAYEW